MMISTKKLRISMMKWIYTILIKKKACMKIENGKWNNKNNRMYKIIFKSIFSQNSHTLNEVQENTDDRTYQFPVNTSDFERQKNKNNNN